MKAVWTAALVFGVLSGPALAADLCTPLATQIRANSDALKGEGAMSAMLRRQSRLQPRQRRFIPFNYNVDAETVIAQLPAGLKKEEGEENEGPASQADDMILSGALNGSALHLITIARSTLALVILETGPPHPPISVEAALFDPRKGKQPLKQPQLPTRLEHGRREDTEPSHYVDDVYPAYVAGQWALAENRRDRWEQFEVMHLTPFDEKGWGNPCAVEAEFQQILAPNVIRLGEGSPVTADTFGALMRELAQEHGLKRAISTDFHMDRSALTPSEASLAEKMMALKEAQWSWFGNGNEPSARISPSDNIAFPVRLQGRLYLMVMGHIHYYDTSLPHFGFELLDLQTEKLIPVAIGRLNIERGALVGLTVTTAQ